MIDGDTNLNLFLPVFPQKDAILVTGAPATIINNWIARGYIELSKHPKAQALGRKMFSFYDILKLKTMWQLSSLNVQAQFAEKIGMLVVARGSLLGQRKNKFFEKDWAGMGHSLEIADPKIELEIILLPENGGIRQGYRFPTIKNYPLKDTYIAIPADKLCRQTFLYICDLHFEGSKLKTNWELMQTSYTEEEIIEIFEDFERSISFVREELTLGLQVRFDADKK